ncbi:MAG: PAS domain S-box protein [Terriglobales bacterium]
MRATMFKPSVQPTVSAAPSRAHERHVVQLYTDNGFLIDVVSRFIGGMIAVGDSALVIATSSHQQGLAKRLSERGLDMEKAAAQGRYITMDAKETLDGLMVDGAVDESRFTEVIGGVLTRMRGACGGKDSRIAVFGEMVALLWAEGKPQEALRVEQLWNGLSPEHTFALLCAYPLSVFSDGHHIEPFLRICEQHTGVIPSEAYLASGADEDRLRDIARLEQKNQVLERELALRDSEAKFRLLVEAVRDYAIFMLDPEGNVTSWNLGAERIKGYESTDILGEHFSRFYCDQDVRNGKPEMELEEAKKTGRFEDEGWRLRKDGSRFWANVVITAVRDQGGTLLGFAKVTRDITDKMEAQRALQSEVEERRQAELQLQHSQKSLRQLSLHLLRTQDEERRRIGRDLHDSLGQYLAVLKIKLDTLARHLEAKRDEAAQDLSSQCLILTEDSIRELRTVSYLLYPPMLEEMGLKSAIPWYLDGFAARSGIRTTFEIQADVGRLPRDSELALFRVLQESLTNVHRHSGSETARVRLLYRDEMCMLEIEDEGKGMPPQLMEQSGEDWMGALGVGLRGMNERMSQLGGRLEVFAKKDRGTIVRAFVPAFESPITDIASTA